MGWHKHILFSKFLIVWFEYINSISSIYKIYQIYESPMIAVLTAQTGNLFIKAFWNGITIIGLEPNHDYH